MNTIVPVLSVPVPAMPRGARVAADLVARFLNWMTRPATPRVLSRSEEAAEVREMADRVQRTDPGFAADLWAAAARHEGLADR